ncbi:MAG TPA: ribulose-phosphate 3-epimerase [Candidatus Aphodoplasma excrementigallinarum]|uniref:Ribulose-phosphate 3-epimerase n=1 Tax=Candidatus Aphodoplasma excrementigallinarum TaxID=2840673 RepID=A0A9D1NGE2_9FIRM|nr:ribulose-phosphate 3-epimerase [Candidatus Aphodoplasma excrementigallinarum]
MIKIAPSILSADFSRLGEQIDAAARGGAPYLHIDVMDGMFVPNITLGPVVIKSIRKTSGLVFDVHLMIERPERYIEAFAEAGADIITVHSEATSDLAGCLRQIKACGKRAGVSIKPATPVSAIAHVIGEVDMALVMSVEPGFGGQGYLSQADEKLRQLRGMVRPDADLSVDGGVKLSNLAHVIGMGANTVVAGSAIFGAEDVCAQTAAFVARAREVEEALVCGR